MTDTGQYFPQETAVAVEPWDRHQELCVFWPKVSFSPAGLGHPSRLLEAETNSCPSSPAFRTGSEPSLSPTVVQRVTSESQVGEALRGSDSQLCPKPPPKPSKALPMKPPDSPLASYSAEGLCCELSPIRAPASAKQHLCQNSYVEHLSQKEGGAHSFRNSETSYLILEDDLIVDFADPVEASTEMAEEDSIFSAPVFETVSSFKPNDFESKLLPPENKPLETSMLRRVKELFNSNNPKMIAQHILRMDCKVKKWILCFVFYCAGVDFSRELIWKDQWVNLQLM